MLINTTIREVEDANYNYGQKIRTGTAVINSERIVRYHGVDRTGTDDDTRILYNLRGDDRRENNVEIVVDATLAEVNTAVAASTETTVTVTHFTGVNDVFSGSTEANTRFVRDFVIAYARGTADSYQWWGEGTFKNIELRVNQTLAALVTAATP